VRAGARPRGGAPAQEALSRGDARTRAGARIPIRRRPRCTRSKSVSGNRIAQTERESQLAQEVAEAIAAARRAFSSGQRDQAIADIQSFYARAPDTTIAAEISRLVAEAKRIAAAEQRAAEAAGHATAAETALAAGNPQQALAMANRALAIDPGHLFARNSRGSRARR